MIRDFCNVSQLQNGKLQFFDVPCIRHLLQHCRLSQVRHGSLVACTFDETIRTGVLYAAMLLATSGVKRLNGGDRDGVRTRHHRIKSSTLYHLSYAATMYVRVVVVWRDGGGHNFARNYGADLLKWFAAMSPCGAHFGSTCVVGVFVTRIEYFWYVHRHMC